MTDKINPYLRSRIKNAYLVCISCGKKHGRLPKDPDQVKLKKGTCGICGRNVMVADFKEFGFGKYD